VLIAPDLEDRQHARSRACSFLAGAQMPPGIVTSARAMPLILTMPPPTPSLTRPCVVCGCGPIVAKWRRDRESKGELINADAILVYRQGPRHQVSPCSQRGWRATRSLRFADR
jgi:hypothetical protein